MTESEKIWTDEEILILARVTGRQVIIAVWTDGEWPKPDSSPDPEKRLPLRTFKLTPDGWSEEKR